MKTLNGIDYLVRKPKVEIERPPLMLLIHGYGSNENDLFSFAEDLPEEFFVVSVRGTHSIMFGGYAWYEIDFVNLEKFNNIPQAMESRGKLIEFIDAIIQKENLNENKTWLCGFSQGAILSYSIALNHPEKIHRAICLSAYPEMQFIGEIDKSKDFSKISFFVSHGIEDPVIPIDWARKGKLLLDELSISNEYHEYWTGHNMIPQNYFDMMDWIKKNK